MIKNRISLFVATFLIVGFFFLALPEKGYSQEIEIGCCEIDIMHEVPIELEATRTESGCTETTIESCKKIGGLFFEGETCNKQTGYCLDPITDVPTLSEWGLIAMASILGIVGYMVIRSRKVTA